MKHGELIKAAVDGKTIQWKHPKDGWVTFYLPARAISSMAHDVSGTEFRIKPEPVPDFVSYGVVKTPKADGKHCTEEYIRAVYHRSLEDGNKQLVRFTIKTDENGKETKIVEIVE